jgi:hypothetical protein
LDVGDDSKFSNSENGHLGMVKGEMTMNQGDDMKKENRKVERHRKRRKGVFRRRQRTPRQDVRHANRGLQRIAG